MLNVMQDMMKDKKSTKWTLLSVQLKTFLGDKKKEKEKKDILFYVVFFKNFYYLLPNNSSYVMRDYKKK